MSLLTPERVPVKVYRWDDEGAPVLDKTPNCIVTIIKACLVTGYGAKEGAGWTMTHEDIETRTKVFKFADGSIPSVSLRLYNDTGKQVNIQLVKDVVDANTVTQVAQCAAPFSQTNFSSGKWVVLATNKGFWFVTSMSTRFGTEQNSGAFILASIVPATNSTGFIIKHSAGTNGSVYPECNAITFPGPQNEDSKAVVYDLTSQTVSENNFNYISQGTSIESDNSIAAPIYYKSGNEIYQLPVYSPSRNDLLNFAIVPGAPSMMNFCTSSGFRHIGNSYVPTDFWDH